MSRERFNKALAKQVGQRLAEVRKSNRESQETVHFKTKLNVGRYERGEVNISLTTLAVLCKHFGITLEEFFKEIKIE